MQWQQAKITVGGQFADALTDLLMEAGALSACVEDTFAETEWDEPIFGEPGMPTDRFWQNSTVSALFDEGVDVGAVVAAVSAALGQPAPLAFTVDALVEQDWVRMTQAQFDPIRISDRLWIVPTWHESPDAAAINIALDPGLAFGTGSHPTTRLCLRWLDAEVRAGDSVMDYGCGSGILAIAAAKLGAGAVAGVDIDPQAMVAAAQNAAQNDVAATFSLPGAFDARPFDTVVANILANPLIGLAATLAGLVRPGGRLALSGILDGQQQEIIDVYSAWFDMREWAVEEGWVCLTGVKRQP